MRTGKFYYGLFPLRIFLFPGEQTTLHIFEPKYLQLITDCINNEDLFGIPYQGKTTLSELGSLDLTVDGTDEVDSNLSLIKGGGGALLREKIIAYNSKSLIIIADDSKKVKKLGEFKLPIEISKFEHSAINDKILLKLEEIGYFGESFIRKINSKNFITDGGNFIYDFSIGSIEEPYMVNQIVNSIPGVIENGLFVDMADVVILGKKGDIEVIKR